MVVPTGRVVDRVGAAESEDPRVAAVAVEPLVHVLVGLVLRCREPADEHGGEAVVREVRRGARDHEPRELVAGIAGVAVLPARLRRDDVRRVARDEVERLACDRLEEAAEPRLDVVECRSAPR